MNPYDASDDDDQFPALLARYSEVLSDGGEVDPSADPSLSPELLQRLQRALKFLRRLQQYRSRPSSAEPVTLVIKEGVTLRDGVLGGMVGRFRILRTLGHGGGGIVFLAFDPDLRREVAVKVPHLTALLSPELRRRFLREARVAASLNHPHLVPVYEVGEANGLCFLVSAYCRGGNLAEWLAARKMPVPAFQAAELLVALADAVHHVHVHGIYHRDIKPGNILLDPRVAPSHRESESTRGATAPPLSNGESTFVPRLTDFGLVKLNETQTEPTHSGTVLGTVSYMAPEQVEGRVRDIGPATDIYGLGVLLYEVLTGRPPFRGVSDADTLRQVLTDEPVPPRRLRRDLPADLETICLKCLEKEPARRYARAAELAGDLRRFLKGEAIQARPLSLVQRFWFWSRRPERVRNAGVIMLFSNLGMIAWNLFAQLCVLVGLIQTPTPDRALAYSYCCIFFIYSPMAWLGRLTMARKTWAVWSGAGTAVFQLAYYIWFSMIVPLDVGLPLKRQEILIASTPFVCLAALEVGAYLLALLALVCDRGRCPSQK